MKYKSIVGLIALVGSIGWLYAEQTQPHAIVAGDYVVIDTLTLSPDSNLVISTACAPICSSIVLVLDRQGNQVGQVMPPFEHAVFAEAYIEDRRLMWRDNTPLLMNDELQQ